LETGADGWSAALSAPAPMTATAIVDIVQSATLDREDFAPLLRSLMNPP
jgi:hypothetical protein